MDDGEAGSERGRLIVVRHGETAWSRAGRHTGRTDVPLEPEGEAQARALGERLAGRSFEKVLTSPLGRARRTAELAGFPEAEPCDALAEWDYGDVEGRRTAEIRQERPGWSIWSDGAPGGESVAEVGRRADVVIARVREEEGDVLAFAHAHLLRVLGARWIGLAPRSGSAFVLSPATISVLGWEREVPVICRWNDAAGDPLV